MFIRDPSELLLSVSREEYDDFAQKKEIKLIHSRDEITTGQSVPETRCARKYFYFLFRSLQMLWRDIVDFAVCKESQDD